jgi:hypothetical protein
MTVENSFCLLKSEAYLFRKAAYIERLIRESGLEIVDVWKVKLTFRDVFRMYPGLMPRITMTLRLLPLLYVDLFIVRGPAAVRRMRELKYQLRREMWGLKAGGFLHTPDNSVECRDHMLIMAERRARLLYSLKG